MRSLFDFLNGEERKIFENHLEILKFKEDEVIIKEGTKNNSLYIIKKGLIRVQKKVEGKDMILDDLKEGEIYIPFAGIAVLNENDKRDYAAVEKDVKTSGKKSLYDRVSELPE
ncbi:MAG: cyclic nucleotide-binding domain-containing protein, partial [Thermoanaerobaculia bacterium]